MSSLTIPAGTSKSLFMAIQQASSASSPPIPSQATSKLTEINALDLYGSHGGKLHSSVPSKFHIQKCRCWGNKNVPDVLPHQFKKISNIVYTGIPRAAFLNALSMGLGPNRLQCGNDFGQGVYWSYNLSMAKEYANNHGVILAVDFRGQGRPLTMKIFRGEEWTREVKRHVCQWGPYHRAEPTEFFTDFYIGRVSANHPEVEKCQEPIPGEGDQIVARSQNACNYMMRYLISVTFIDDP